MLQPQELVDVVDVLRDQPRLRRVDARASRGSPTSAPARSSCRRRRWGCPGPRRAPACAGWPAHSAALRRSRRSTASAGRSSSAPAAAPRSRCAPARRRWPGRLPARSAASRSRGSRPPSARRAASAPSHAGAGRRTSRGTCVKWKVGKGAPRSMPNVFSISLRTGRNPITAFASGATEPPTWPSTSLRPSSQLRHS